MSLRRKSQLSFVIFVICLLKWVLVNVQGAIPVYGSMNRIISWIVFLPLIMVGLFFSLKVIFLSIKAQRHEGRITNLLLVSPLIFFIIFFFLIL